MQTICLLKMASVSVAIQAFFEESITILSVGLSFEHIIPNFKVVKVHLRQARVEKANDHGLDEHFDVFIRDDEWLWQSYPTQICVSDAFIIKVSLLA